MLDSIMVAAPPQMVVLLMDWISTSHRIEHVNLKEYKKIYL